MKILFTLGGLRIPFFGTVIEPAMQILSYDAKKKNLNPEKVTDMAVSALLGGIIASLIFIKKNKG